MRTRFESRFDGMTFKFDAVRVAILFSVAVFTLGLAGCAGDDVLVPSSGPATENPAAAGGGNVIPSVGGAGNGGGISGGGAGAGGAGQGAR